MHSTSGIPPLVKIENIIIITRHVLHTGTTLFTSGEKSLHGTSHGRNSCFCQSIYTEGFVPTIL